MYQFLWSFVPLQNIWRDACWQISKRSAFLRVVKRAFTMRFQSSTIRPLLNIAKDVLEYSHVPRHALHTIPLPKVRTRDVLICSAQHVTLSHVNLTVRLCRHCTWHSCFAPFIRSHYVSFRVSDILTKEIPSPTPSTILPS